MMQHRRSGRSLDRNCQSQQYRKSHFQQEIRATETKDEKSRMSDKEAFEGKGFRG